ncbi:reactive intermediate/imine deaminase [Candidatus Saccharibacteria bacterium]|nr:MAG: reactive intermediate/imine deaminase [Candidatus Saccharibacteria bacterium]
MSQAYGPYSPCRVANGFVYSAGQIGAVEGKAPADVQSQVRQALKNLADVLEEAGSGLDMVVKTTVFLTDMSHYAAMNEVYAAEFTKAGVAPARSCIAVAELPRVADRPLLVEIEAVALLREYTA